MLISEYIWLIPLIPAIGSIINGLLGKKLGDRLVSWIGCLSVFLSLLLSLLLFIEMLNLPEGSRSIINRLFTWIHIGPLHLHISFLADPLSAVMSFMVTGISFLIHVYSVGYMHGDKGYYRYFAYLNLFVFSMLLLVLGDNLLLMFVGWEGVGLCSYLLIAFWFTDKEKAAAGMKAFVVNRIGDFGFMLGILLLFWALGARGVWTLDFVELERHHHLLGTGTITLVTLLFFVGAVGKSAQIPLYVWLPDAMAGPTPVSALIHAATMVTAGVYMIGRLNFLYSLAPVTLCIVACMGAATALFAATIGLAQNDIKKVLAYSTVSQLGYMFLAMGVAAYTAGIFHLITHAFFKALLFLGSGSVIHAMSGEQDMRKMGGLKKHMPLTYWTFLIATLAIAGFPPFSGFFSKDEILWNAFSSPHGSWLLWLIGLVTAGLTSFYMFRLVFTTFWGDMRADEDVKAHVHESPPHMTMPLILLAVGAALMGLLGIPAAFKIPNLFHHFLEEVFVTHGDAAQHAVNHSVALEFGLMILSVLIAVGGWWMARKWYVEDTSIPSRFATRFPRAYRTILNKYFIDEIYNAVFVRGLLALKDLLGRFDLHVIDGIVNWWGRFLVRTSGNSGAFDNAVVDGAVNGTAWLVTTSGGILRRIQTGIVQNYLVIIFAGLLVLVWIISG